jgi:asparagine synthase (glutamine-hydrolysing)
MAGFFGFLSKENGFELLNGSEMVQSIFMHFSKTNAQFVGHSEKMGEVIGGNMESLPIPQSSTSPLSDERGNLFLFDGELLNIQEFLPELKEKGLFEEGFSNDQILFCLLREYGMDVLPRLNGAFAFAFYIKEKKQLILGRDRLGEKNLFWAESENRLIFSTETYSIFEKGFPKRLNLDQLDELFFYRIISGPQTIFTGVNKVLPGHVQIWNEDQRLFTTYKWFDFSKEILTHRHQSNPEDWIRKQQNVSFNSKTHTQRSCIISSCDNQILGLLSKGEDPIIRLKEIKIYGNELEFAFELIAIDGKIEILKKKISSGDLFQSLIQWLSKSASPNLDLETLVYSSFFRDSELKFTHALVDVGYTSLFPNQRKKGDLEIVLGDSFSNWIKKISSKGRKNDEFLRLKKIKAFRNVDFQLMTFSNQFFISDLRKLDLKSLNLIPDYRVSVLEEAKRIFPHDRLRQLSYLELNTEEIARNERWEQLGKETGVRIQKPFLDFRLVLELFSLNNSSWQNLIKSTYHYSHAKPNSSPWDWHQLFLDVPEFRSHLEKMHENLVFKQGWLNFIDVPAIVKEFVKDPKSSKHLIEFLFLLSVWYQAQFES